MDLNLENVDIFDMEFENEDIIEYEISESISLLYSKKYKNFYIYGIDYDNAFEEYTIDVKEPFEDIEIDGIKINKSDFEEFKELVLKSA